VVWRRLSLLMAGRRGNFPSPSILDRQTSTMFFRHSSSWVLTKFSPELTWEGYQGAKPVARRAEYG